jgi:hypothetical protein
VILAACTGLPRTPENRVWFRLIDPQHLRSGALGSAHTKKTIGRFNPGPLLVSSDQFATLSLAEDSLVGQFEAGAVLGSYKPGHYVPHPSVTLISMNVQVILTNVMDLTDPHTQTLLGTNAQELTGDWDAYQIRNRRTSVSYPTGIAPTQELGRALFTTGIEGFRSVSAKVPYAKTLTVFPDNRLQTSSLVFTDMSNGTVVHRIP